MKPIYFPFTYISKPVVEALGACFRQTVVYQPSSQNVPEKMRKWEKKGVLDIRVPVKSDENKLDAVLKDYRAWVNFNQGSEISFLKTHAHTIPFFDDTSVLKIREDIKKNAQAGQFHKNHAQKETDLLFNSRMFLHVAQEFDIQNREINRDFLLLEAMEQDLIKNLKGENETLSMENNLNHTLKTDDPGSYMTSERIEAWGHLLRHDQEISGVFITSSRSAFEHLIDKASTAEKLIRFDTITMLENGAEAAERWQDNLMEQLDMLARNSWPASTDGIEIAPADKGDGKKVALTLYILPGETPHEFFARCVGHNVLQAGEGDKDIKFKNTLIGLIEF